VAFHNPLAEGQADTGAGIFRPVMQALKDEKNPLLLFWSNTNAVIPHRKHPITVLQFGGNMDLERFVAAEFGGIAKEILKQLDELNFIAPDDG
jgi:hypothetical protein